MIKPKKHWKNCDRALLGLHWYRMKHKTKHNRGFTLVELSIVLVIIGLLIGGILVAQSMITTARITKIASQLQQYEVAVQNFRTNYKQLPGDSTFFTPPGDNDFIIGSAGGCAPAPNAKLSADEYTQVWAHLSQAKMLDKAYTSYSPRSCNGDHDAYQTVTNYDVVIPSSLLEGKAKTALGRDKFGVTAANTEIFFRITYVTSIEIMKSLTTKFGFAEWCGVNWAIQTSCTDPAANFGRVHYDFTL